jgi:alkylation response protein AidB-like acyl-CoA dehydrogenase
MNLNYSSEDLLFRDEVRSFLEHNLPACLRSKVMEGRRLDREDFMSWHRVLANKGWVAPSWPVELGGTLWTPMQKHIFDEECFLAGAPPVQPPGIKLAAPVIMRYGSEWQKQYFLPRIYQGIDFWCQGYSEPGAGSDLASLKTKATTDGDHYVINGQKTWITLAHWADMMFCLVRTSSEGKRQEGITFLLIDMKTPGITVRPIRTLDEDHEVNEVFFDDVRVPMSHRVGDEGKGWTYAKVLLGHERTAIAGVGRSNRDLRRLKRLAQTQQQGGKPLIQAPVFANKLAKVEVELMALEITVLRVIAAEQQHQGPGPEASMLKIKGTEIRQRLTELMIEAAGPCAMPFALDWLASKAGAPDLVGADIAPVAAYYFNTRKTSIFGGANEVQRNIIASGILGM